MLRYFCTPYFSSLCSSSDTQGNKRNSETGSMAALASAQSESSNDLPQSSNPPSTVAPNLVVPVKPRLEIHPTAHLDPQAYVMGTHTITLGPEVVVHPRARLISAHGPLIIGAATVISERCIVGGLSPDPKEPPSPTLAKSIRTVVGQSVMIHASAEIEAGTFLDDYCLIEPRVVIMKGVNIGKHCKVCAGCTVDRTVAAWLVVCGDGQTRRMRTGADEEGRLISLQREREDTAFILKAAAAKSTFGKRKV